MDPQYLTDLFSGIDVGNGFFLDYFPATYTHNQDVIAFDEGEESLLVTPYASPRAEAPTVEKAPYKTKYFRPAYLKDKREFNPHDLSFRVFGESLQSPLSQTDRLELALVAALREQKEFFFRRLEQMAAEAVVTGKLSILGTSVSYSIDFGKDQNLTQKLQDKDQWSQDKVDVIECLETMSTLVLEKGKCTIDTIVMGKKAWNLFRKSKAVKELLDLRRGDNSTVTISPGRITNGITSKGMLGEYRVFVHLGKYQDPLTGELRSFVPDNVALFLSSQIAGTRHFGAVKDLDAGLLPLPFFVKKIVRDDPSALFLLAQSAPLLIPGRVNGSLTLEVCDA